MESHFRHIPALDSLRGIAILLVLMTHGTFVQLKNSGFLPNLLYDFFTTGWLGVDLFFVLSGFLITSILLLNKQKKNYFKNFYSRRILRIFPLYYSVILFFTFFSVKLPIIGDIWRQHNVNLELWSYFLYMQNFVMARIGEFTGGPIGVTWSLAVEEQFYFLWPLFIFFSNPSRFKFVSIFLIFSALICRIFFYLFNYNFMYSFVLLVSRMDALLIGAITAYFYKYEEDFLKKSAYSIKKAFWILFFALTTIFFYYGGLRINNPFIYTFGYSLIALFFGAFLIIAIYGNDRFLNFFLKSRFLAVCGKYSYAMYLFHISINEYLFKTKYLNFQNFTSVLILNQCLHFIVYFTITIFLAYMSYHLFERHFLRMKKFFV